MSSPSSNTSPSSDGSVSPLSLRSNRAVRPVNGRPRPQSLESSTSVTSVLRPLSSIPEAEPATSTTTQADSAASPSSATEGSSPLSPIRLRSKSSALNMFPAPTASPSEPRSYPEIQRDLDEFTEFLKKTPAEEAKEAADNAAAQAKSEHASQQDPSAGTTAPAVSSQEETRPVRPTISNPSYWHHRYDDPPPGGFEAAMFKMQKRE